MAQAIYEAAGMRLAAELAELRPEDLPQYLSRNADDLIRGEHPFADYMRMKFREKGVLQQDVFLAADLPERYGYKLISGQKHTTQRDTILRICLAARFDLCETDEALFNGFGAVACTDGYIHMPGDHLLFTINKLSLV